MNNVLGGSNYVLKAFNVSLVKALTALVFCAVAFASAQADSFTPVPDLIAPVYYSAALLQNGKVLMLGANSGALLYDPATGRSAVTGSPGKNPGSGSMTMLTNGMLLLAGGSPEGFSTNGTQLYNAQTETWQPGQPMIFPRFGHTATLLKNGQVLVAGGVTVNVLGLTTELYDPATGTWTTNGVLNCGRSYHQAVLLQDGRVLVCGGYATNGGAPGTNSAEIYDPATGRWTYTGSMATGREEFTASLLPNGKVLVVGGSTNEFALPELYDPVSGTWSPTPPLAVQPQYYATMTLLPNGKVLLAGGINESNASAVELYDPVANTWTQTVSLNTWRYFHSATLLPSGQVLIAGGYVYWMAGGPYPLPSAEVYDPGINPSTGTLTNTGGMNSPREFFASTLLPNGKILVEGGQASNNFWSSAELFDPATGTWSFTGSMSEQRANHTATLLPNGKVLVVGDGTDYTPELYDPATEVWSNAANALAAHEYGTATLLRNGKVLAVGDLLSHRFATELYDPIRNIWTATGLLNVGRNSHTATLLPSGKVLIAGGADASAELFDPVSGKWITTGSMTTARGDHTATLMPNGKVLVTGGTVNFTPLASAELYDPATGTWTVTGAMILDRSAHTATLLKNGKVQVTGGNFDHPGPFAETYDPVTQVWSAATTNSNPLLLQYGTTALLADGRVLITGGSSGGGAVTNAWLYDPNLGFSNAWQPQITSVPSPLASGGSLTVNGNGFRKFLGGAAVANAQTSSTDFPLLQLRSIESGQTTFLLATNWSSNSFMSLPVTNFPPGYALATVFVSGIPSTSSVVNISVPVPTPPVLANAGVGTNGGFQFAFTNSPGALFGVWASTNAAAAVTDWTALGAVTEVSPGQFQFSDASATNGGQRFYSVRAP